MVQAWGSFWALVGQQTHNVGAGVSAGLLDNSHHIRSPGVMTAVTGDVEGCRDGGVAVKRVKMHRPDLAGPTPGQKAGTRKVAEAYKGLRSVQLSTLAGMDVVRPAWGVRSTHTGSWCVMCNDVRPVAKGSVLLVRGWNTYMHSVPVRVDAKRTVPV